MREIYQLLLFFILQAIICPTFEEFTYFFLMDVIGVTKFLFSIVVLTGQLCGVIGSLVYKACFRAVDTRWMIFWAIVFHIIGDFLNFVYAKRWNLEIGIPDLVFLFLTDSLFTCIRLVLYSIPIMALFAKITPEKIEGTTFATLTGTMNFGNTVIAPAMGTWINHQFVGVTKDDLSRYDVLCLISVCCVAVSFVLVFLIPTKA